MTPRLGLGLLGACCGVIVSCDGGGCEIASAPPAGVSAVVDSYRPKLLGATKIVLKLFLMLVLMASMGLPAFTKCGFTWALAFEGVEQVAAGDSGNVADSAHSPDTYSSSVDSIEWPSSMDYYGNDRENPVMVGADVSLSLTSDDSARALERRGTLR